MKKIIYFLTIPLFMTFFFISCSKSGGSGGTGGGSGGGGGGGNTACSGTPGPLFNSVKSILQTNCALSGCHSASSPQNGINFTDNCTIVAQSTRIKVRAVDQAGTSSQMPTPPLAPLTTTERQAINNWISAGGRFTD